MYETQDDVRARNQEIILHAIDPQLPAVGRVCSLKVHNWDQPFDIIPEMVVQSGSIVEAVGTLVTHPDIQVKILFNKEDKIGYYKRITPLSEKEAGIILSFSRRSDYLNESSSYP